MKWIAKAEQITSPGEDGTDKRVVISHIEGKGITGIQKKLTCKHHKSINLGQGIAPKNR